ncbi:MAG: hypothetical protein KC931_12385, partial [Candidatus Omnitrophica bacterium]|nr:hypothetical protein [Candidatus Omnitrophota bacterium]
KPGDVLTSGQKVNVMVTKTDWENKKIGLSIKACEAKTGSSEPREASDHLSHMTYSDPVPAEEETGMSEFGELLNKALTKDRPEGENE